MLQFWGTLVPSENQRIDNSCEVLSTCSVHASRSDGKGVVGCAASVPRLQCPQLILSLAQSLWAWGLQDWSPLFKA